MGNEKELGSIKITEIGDGLRIDIAGKSLKDMFKNCCCTVAVKDGDKSGEECCSDKSDTK